MNSLQIIARSSGLKGLVQAACVDGTDLRAWSSRSLDDNKRGLGDPDARLGRSRKGFYLGYRSVFLTDIEGFPLGHMETPANVNEPLLVEPLLDRVLGEDIEVELLAGDSGFESRRVFEALEARRMARAHSEALIAGLHEHPHIEAMPKTHNISKSAGHWHQKPLILVHYLTEELLP